MITYSLNIYQLDTSDSITSTEGAPLNGVVTRAKWEYIATDDADGVESRWVGKTELDVSSVSSASFTLFGNLQSSQVEQWIRDASPENLFSEVEEILVTRIDVIRKKKATEESRMPPW